MGISSAPAGLAANHAEFEALVARAAFESDRGRDRTAAAVLQSAARFAWYNHPGEFRSPKLEDLAARLADRLPDEDPIGGFEGHVVHVVSQAYLTGGHTRLVWRWIENEPARPHSVILVGQQAVPVPEPLATAVTQAGGRILDIGRANSSLLTRARTLRRIARGGPLVVILHIHPYDVVPSLALQGVDVRVVFVNHADHVFSVGMDVADLVADIRPAGQRLSMSARSISPARSTLLPIPLGAPPRGRADEARARLGLSPDDVVLVSIATGYKYGAERGRHFVDVHLDFVLAHPDVHLVVVGPEDEGRWREARESTRGRFRAVGRVPDVNDYYAASDIYVDSLPFASLTSLLDAAARGIPAVAFADLVPDSVLTSDDVSLSDPAVHFADRASYLAQLERLVRDRALRVEVGSALAANVARDHLPPGWNERLAAVLAADSGAAHPVVDQSGGPTSDGRPALDEALVDFQIVSGLAEPGWLARLRDAPYLPLRDRWRLLRSLPRGRRLRSGGYLLPDAFRSALKVTLRRLRR
jgi:hypothetical protein